MGRICEYCGGIKMKKLFSLKGCKIFPVGEQNYALKEGGLLMIYTSYSMTYILVGIEICIICMLQMIAGINCWSIGIIPLLIIIGGLSMLFCYLVLWKDDRYLEYFQRYRKESIRKRAVWVVATQLFCILLFVIFLWILKHPHEFPGLFTPVA